MLNLIEIFPEINHVLRRVVLNNLEKLTYDMLKCSAVAAKNPRIFSHPNWAFCKLPIIADCRRQKS
uniref:Uncharacterized protein n=1 Tax=Romanomermis culicivorax TaxID=13658 RepID=A0A915KB42_ROMCU